MAISIRILHHGKRTPTIHSLLVDIIDPIIAVNLVLVFPVWMGNLADLVIVGDKVTKLLEISRKSDVGWEFVGESSKHFSVFK